MRWLVASALTVLIIAIPMRSILHREPRYPRGAHGFPTLPGRLEPTATDVPPSVFESRPTEPIFERRATDSTFEMRRVSAVFETRPTSLKEIFGKPEL